MAATAALGSRYEARNPGDGVEPPAQAAGVAVGRGSLSRLSAVSARFDSRFF